MRIAKKNLFSFDCDAVCIPTNGHIGKDGRAVMGAGVAKQAVEKFGSSVLSSLADSILRNGHNVRPFLLKKNRSELDYDLLSFPTKPGKIYPASEGWACVLPRYRPKNKDDCPDWIPGWQGYSRIEIIKHSALELVEVAKEYGYRKVILPAVGCGMGGLSWKESVCPMLEEILDDRFTVTLR